MACVTQGAHGIDPAELLAQAGWVRSVVRRLVLDEAQAEEVVQDTWVVALQAPRPSQTGGLRAWLAAVARNLARRRRRREVLREAVEREAARRAPGATGQSEVERMQLQRVLVDAVLELPDPLRTAVILRHLDGCSAEEIARRQGGSPAAARQRVHRGLAELRRRLSGRLGEESGGCLALLPLLGRGWNTTTLAGGIAVGSKLTLGVAAAALAALALWLARAPEEGRGSVVRGEGALPPSSSEGAPAAGALGATPRSDALPESPTAPAGNTARAPAPPEAPAAETLRPRIRVTDSAGRGLQGVVLTVLLPGDPIELESDGEGRFGGELPASLAEHPRRLAFAREDYLPRSLEHDLAQPLTVALQALPLVRGRVLDPDGAPARPRGYVRASVLDAATRENRTREVELAPDGSYEIRGLALGRLVRLEARARGTASTALVLDRETAPDERIEQDLTLRPGAVVTGTVLDARTRQPIPGATVWCEAFSPQEDSVHPVAVADAEGRFRLEGADEDVRAESGTAVALFWLVARAEGYASAPLNHYASAPSDAHVYDFELELEPASASLRVRVLLDEETPAAGATVWAIDAEGNPFFETADANGEHVFEGLPAGPFALWLSWERAPIQIGSPGSVLRSLQIAPTLKRDRRVDLELEAGQARSESFVLDPPGTASLAGRVIDAQGRGVPDHAVRCQLNFDLHNLRLASGWDETRTDAEGDYAFAGLHPGLYQVWATDEGGTLPCAEPHDVYVRVPEEGDATVQDLRVGACLTVEGRIETDGTDGVGLTLALTDPDDGTTLAETEPAADGSFRFEPVRTRAYELVLLRGDEVLDRTPVDAATASGIFLRAR